MQGKEPITCKNCKSWKDCPGFGWFSPGDIRYCRDQVKWILEHLISMEDGRWPAEYSTKPCEPSNRQPSGAAPFEKIKEITADVTKRVNRCGNDGKLAFQVLSAGWDVDTLSTISGIDSGKYEKRIRKVIGYCSGWKEREISYFEYCRMKPRQLQKVAKM